jgi:serine/threonine protein kinase
MLGRGSVGRVYLARHCATNCYFALKKIAKSEVKDIKQFCYGIKCHMFLSSPHIVQLYACFSD